METGENKITDIDENNGSTSGEFSGIVGSTKTPGKRGRPPGSKTKTVSISQNNSGKNSDQNGSNSGSLESAKLIGVGAVALLELMESMVHNNCANKIEKKLPEKLGEFKQMVQELQLQVKEKEIISDAVTGIAVRYEFATKYARELVLGVTLGQYMLRQGAILRFTENVVKSKTESSILKQEEK